MKSYYFFHQHYKIYNIITIKEILIFFHLNLYYMIIIINQMFFLIILNYYMEENDLKFSPEKNIFNLASQFFTLSISPIFEQINISGLSS